MKFYFCFIVIVIYGTNGSPVKTPKKGMPYDNCACETFSCACCTTLFVPQIRLNDTVCISFAYEPKDYGISFIFQIDDDVLINETISARNPPPICIPIPYIEDFIDGCVHFTDLKITNTDFHGCASLEARMWWVYVVAEVELGCWDTGAPDKNIAGGHITSNSNNLTNLVIHDFKPLDKAHQLLKDRVKYSIHDSQSTGNSSVPDPQSIEQNSAQDLHANKVLLLLLIVFSIFVKKVMQY